MKHFNEDIDEVEIPYAHLDSMNYQAKRVISTAAHALFPGASVFLVGDIDTDSLLLSPKAIAEYPRAEWFVEAQMRRMFDLLPEFPDTYLFLDIETHNAEKRWDMPLESFFRLGQYAWGEGPIQTTTDLDEVLALIEQAERVIAHNGHSFDFSVLLGNSALDLTFEGKLFDTYTYAKLKFPCPVTYKHANGTTYRSNTSPAQYRRWYGLDNLAYQFGSARKFGDLAALAAKYNPPKTPRSELDFGLVPLDDLDFLAYARQDIGALRELTRSMVTVGGLDDYDFREQKKDAINAAMTLNGCLIDVPLAQSLVDIAEKKKAELLMQLERDYNFPTKGKMPWRTKAGKEAIERLLLDVGVDIHTPDWPKTSTGNPSLGGDALVEGTRGTPAESLGESLAILQGQRPLAAQTLRYTYSDNRVHPDIDSLQRSGRSSTTEPAVTTFGSRGNTEDKEYFIPDPGNVMISLDLSNADARAVAFMSGDQEYKKRFEPGVDGHELTGRLMFGDTYDTDPKVYRNIAKSLSHAWGYRAGLKTLIRTSGQDEETARHFVNTMAKAYPAVTAWQNRMYELGQSGWLENAWGRNMAVVADRAYTQAPALMGQSSTSEILADGLINLTLRYRDYVKYLVFGVHDELIVQAPKDKWRQVVDALLECTEQTINGITFELSYGEPAKNWREASH